jgi:hypothetical protein
MDPAFAPFVPPSVSARHPGAVPALLSGALLARLAPALKRPSVEITFERAAALAGFLRACRRDDAIAVVGVDPTRRRRTPQAAGELLHALLQVAADVGFEGPLLTVARAGHSALGAAGADDEPWVVSLARDIEAGFTAMAVPADAFDDAAVLSRVAASVAVLDLGLELEVSPGRDATLLLVAAAERAIPFCAVRGARPSDEVGKATLVLSWDELAPPLPQPHARVNLDALFAKDLRAHNEGQLDDEGLETRAWLLTTRALATLGAGGAAPLLADALDAARLDR